jgi:hypothetical protein
MIASADRRPANGQETGGLRAKARWAMARRDLLEFIRDRRTLFVTLLLPMAMYPILALSSAPLATPTLAGPTNGQPGFVGLSLVGLKRTRTPPPAELLAELGKPGLVYFDWEVTSENVPHWTAGLQVKDISLGLRPPAANGPALRWLKETTSTLDNTVTAVVQKAPGTFEFQRKAPAGLTAFELVVLTRWLDPPTTRPTRSQATRKAPAAAVPSGKP